MKDDAQESSDRCEGDRARADRWPTTWPRLGRRAFLSAAGAVLAGGSGFKFWSDHDERSCRADVFIARAKSYDDDLPRIIRSGLGELGLGRAWVRGKSVLLKPNLVEPTREAPHVNTHPAAGPGGGGGLARPGGRARSSSPRGRGTAATPELVLEQSGLGPVLDEEGLEFVDLNHDDVFSVAEPT